MKVDLVPCSNKSPQCQSKLIIECQPDNHAYSKPQIKSIWHHGLGIHLGDFLQHCRRRQSIPVHHTHFEVRIVLDKEGSSAVEGLVLVKCPQSKHLDSLLVRRNYRILNVRVNPFPLREKSNQEEDCTSDMLPFSSSILLWDKWLGRGGCIV